MASRVPALTVQTMRLFIIFWFVLVAFIPANAQSIRLHGLLTDKSDGQPLAGVTVSIPSLQKGTLSDSLGRYSLRIEANREIEVRFSLLSYRSVRRVIQIGQTDLLLNVVMEEDPQQLEEVVVIGETLQEKLATTQMSKATVTADEIKKIPVIFGEADVLKVLQLKPGVQSGGEGSSGIFVRGGGPDQNLFLLDGAPIYNASHLFGFFSIFNSDAVRSVDLYKGNFPAQYGGRLSSVIDVHMREGSREKFQGQGGIGLIASRLTLEGPIRRGKGSWIGSFRRTYADVFTRLINQANASNPNVDPIPDYFFQDANLKGVYDLSPKDQLMFSGYWGRDIFVFRNRNVRFRFAWGNDLAHIRWTRQIRPAQRRQVSLIYSRYNYNLRNQFGEFGFEAGSEIRDVQAQVHYDHQIGTHSLQYGGTGIWHRFVIGRLQAGGGDFNFEVGNTIHTGESAAWFSDDWKVNTRLQIQSGLRVSGYLNGPTTFAYAEPRMAARYSVTERIALKAALAHTYQYAHLVANSGASLPTDVWYPSEARVKPQRAIQVTGGWSWLSPNANWLLSQEVYYKDMANTLDLRDGAQIFVNNDLPGEFVYGRGWAYGSEWYLEKKGGRTTGWLGYTLAWSWRSFDQIMEGKAFHPRYDQRHNISLVVMHALSKRVFLSFTWVYNTGNAVSLPIGRYFVQDIPGSGDIPQIAPLFTERNSFRMVSYHRMDIGLIWKFKPRWGESDLTFNIYNAYDRRNPYFIYFAELRDDNENLLGFQPRQVSLFPILPAFTYNFRF